LLLSALFHWLVFIFPWVWLVIGWIGGYTFRYPIWALALAATGLALRGLTAAVTRQRVGDAFLMPVSVVLMTLVAGQALRWRWSGGPAWKGRTYPFSKG
jgi:chlorobactene glucosyltransferase